MEPSFSSSGPYTAVPSTLFEAISVTDSSRSISAMKGTPAADPPTPCLPSARKGSTAPAWNGCRRLQICETLVPDTNKGQSPCPGTLPPQQRCRSRRGHTNNGNKIHAPFKDPDRTHRFSCCSRQRLAARRRAGVRLYHLQQRRRLLAYGQSRHLPRRDPGLP